MTELQKFYDEAGIETVIVTSAVGELDVGIRHMKGIVRFPNYWKRSNKYILRAAGEIASALVLGLIARFSKKFEDIDRIIVYSPTIFWAITLKFAKFNPKQVLLIVRDIFPYWLLKTGLLRETNLAYLSLNFIAKLQFKKAGRIYIQSENDAQLLREQYSIPGNKIAILNTWMNPIDFKPSQRLDKFIDKNSKNVLWLGNMGIAQNRDFVITVVKKALKLDGSLKFNIVGLKIHDRHALQRALMSIAEPDKKRVRIIEHLTHEECAQLALRSDLGLVSLGPQTTDGNIPGKFITYTMTGLPVFALCEEKSAISKIIVVERLGQVYHGQDAALGAGILVETLRNQYDKQNIHRYFASQHSTETAVQTLLAQ
ncbi:hypothetical protein N8760_05195 [Rhodobacteraceae bacterium]|nr:hypothetical protein [Paracoccaceae bacterium]